MKKLLLILLIMVFNGVLYAQSAPGSSNNTSDFCTAFKKVLSAADQNFIPLVKNYSDNEFFYKESVVKLPGFNTYYSISIYPAASLYYFATNRNFSTEKECLAEFDKIFLKINNCTGLESVTKVKEAQLHNNEWISGKNKIILNMFKDTNNFVLEIFIKKIK